VNDRPTLDQIASVKIFENAPLQRVDLGGISTGAANENQTLTVLAVTDHPELIQDLVVNYQSPSLEGDLTFVAAPDSTGVATITLLVQDNGGTSQGGQDLRTLGFTVTVLAHDEDTDGDGFTNLQESMAGTDPLDPADALGISTEQLENEARISFKTVYGRHYRLEYNNSFPNADWEVLADNIEGTGEIVEVVDSESASQAQRFYRVALMP